MLFLWSIFIFMHIFVYCHYVLIKRKNEYGVLPNLLCSPADRLFRKVILVTVAYNI